MKNYIGVKIVKAEPQEKDYGRHLRLAAHAGDLFGACIGAGVMVLSGECHNITHFQICGSIEAGFDDIIPLECGCGQMIELAKKMGIWEENDAYVPEPADIILYDWDDNGIGNNTGWPDHVGMAEKVAGSLPCGSLPTFSSLPSPA